MAKASVMNAALPLGFTGLIFLSPLSAGLQKKNREGGLRNEKGQKQGGLELFSHLYSPPFFYQSDFATQHNTTQSKGGLDMFSHL